MKTRKKVLSVSIHDCRVDVFRSGGSGGQNQNKVSSGVRVTHDPSGAVGEARDSRDQSRNKLMAFKRMVATRKFKGWATVEAMTQPDDLKYEYGGAALLLDTSGTGVVPPSAH